MGLYQDLVKQKMRIRAGFWDSKKSGLKYSKLNEINNYTLNTQSLQTIQRNKIKNNISVKKANEILNNLASYNPMRLEKEVANQILQRITTILNSPFASQAKNFSISSKYTDAAQELQVLLSQIVPNIPIPNTILEQLNRGVFEEKDKNFYNYIQEKANFFEQIAASFFTGEQNIGIETGKWGSVSDYNRQLITDIYVFLKSNQISGNVIPYNPSGDFKKDLQTISKSNSIEIKTNIQNFSNWLNDKCSGNASLRFSIDDQLLDSMNKVSALRIQAKSGTNQGLLNKSGRTTISLRELESNNHHLNLLQSLEIEAKDMLYKTRPIHSSALDAYANYVLSKNIDKTSLVKDNNLYFTDIGFTTADEWMKTKGKYLKFKKKVGLNAQLLQTNRSYGLYTI